MNIGSGNKSSLVVCVNPFMHAYHHDIWHLGNPFQNPATLFFLQCSLIFIVSQCIDLCLKPLGQCSIVSQILGGVILGPSLLGHNKYLAESLFPAKGSTTIDTSATFGVMYFFFTAGVKMDPTTLLKTETKGVTIGLSVFLFTLTIPTTMSILMVKYVSMDMSLAKSLPFIATSQSITAYIVIAIFLRELQILNTDLGRLAISIAMFGDMVGFASHVILVPIVLQMKGGHIGRLIFQISSAIALFFVIFYVVRPMLLRILRHSAKPVNELLIISILVLVLISGLISEYIGQHYVMGPLLLGLAIPEGPPLGTALMRKMETLTYGFFYPSYLAASGLHINIFKVDLKSLWIVCVIVVVAIVVKICAVMLTGYYHNVSMKDCFVMGLILNARGIAEIVVYNIWRARKLMTDQEFSLAVLSIIVVNAIITPLIKFLYDPSKQYYSITRCSMQHSKRESKLRIMVCIHKNESIPTMMSLLEASYASEESNIEVIALILVEILGRSRPLLVAHQPHETLNSTSPKSTQIHNAFRQYAYQQKGCAKVQSFTSISNFDTMHDDVCRIALDRSANILIMPFHKHWEIDGSVVIINRAIQNMNIKILERAPCSVGILIDKGMNMINSSLSSLLSSKPVYHVAVFFIGGADDTEALAYSSRMCRHKHVEVTIIRYIQFGSENSKERKHDSDLIDEYRCVNIGNSRFKIVEEVIRDGEEMLSSIRKMKNKYELVIVGREHPQTILVDGFQEWSECKELGVVGDMLASQDFETKASILVVQQQRMIKKSVKHNKGSSMPNERDQKVHDFPFHEIPRSGSWSV
ncbi:PREDICTED: cation/H(+) antiporter 15-like [Lupinus angustifolius]|uniref:cation/H(+) antiporter 15-like n=1 Tax=Lupinus angustifolius TaxID=3871 RepID=UPI00092E5DF0|nr:PREDICTED: cation/H(+) antiporter 15-like [Lupinus angustifolius]